MNTEGTPGTLLLLGIVAIVLFGGTKNVINVPPLSNNNFTPEDVTIEQKIQNTQTEIDKLKKQLQLEEDKKTQSQYSGIVTLSYINKSTNPREEYLVIKVGGDALEAIPVTGWILKSINTGNQVTIPKGTYLFFTGMMNAEENILLIAGDTLYLVTGISPNGVSFKINKCSGYLGQLQTFIPYLNNDCPAPKNEDLSSIPKLAVNNDCLDYIDSINSCKIQTTPLPINTHKNDKDFYKQEWRVYLKRSESIWKDKKEIIILYDSVGQIVDTIKY